MPTITELRQKYPQYQDMSDEQFADKFHQKYYSDMPREEFNQKIGFSAQQSPAQQQPQQSQSLMGKITGALDPIGNAITQPLMGFGNAVGNDIAELANLIPGVNVPQIKTGEGLGYDIGHLGGKLASYLGLGKGTELARIGAKSIPALEKAATALEGSPLRESLKRTLGSTAYGALENPEDRTTGALLGAAAGGLGEIVPFAAATLTAPRKVMGDISNYIAKNQSKATANYEDVIKNAGHQPIYKAESPVYGSYKKYGGEYKKLDKNIFNVDSDIKEAHQLFKQDPTVANAHALQSDMGKKIGKLHLKEIKGELSSEEEKVLDNLREARNAIKKDTSKFLEKHDPELANKYKEASDIYKDIIEPSRKLKGEETPKDFARVLSGLKKKGEKTNRELAPEFQEKLDKLQDSLFKQKLSGGAVASALAGAHGIPFNEILEAGLLGKLSGLKAPKGLSDKTQKGIGYIGQTGKTLADILKSSLIGQ